MKLLLTTIVISVSANAMALPFRYDVNTNTIIDLPLQATFYESDDELQCKIFLRDTADFLGVNDVHIFVYGNTNKLEFSSKLSLYEFEYQDLIAASFSISKDNIPFSKIRIAALERNTRPDGSPQTFHYFYHIPFRVFYQHFKGNKHIPWSTDPENSLQLQTFLNKKFVIHRKSIPNQSTYSINASGGSE